MKIAYIGLRAIGENCAGGIESHVRELAVRMAARGHEVTVFCRGRYSGKGPGGNGRLKTVNLPAIYTKHLEAISHTAISLPALFSGYDIVHIHACGPSLLSWVPRLSRSKVVVTVHGLDFMRAKWNGLATLVLKAGAWTAVKCPHRTIVVSKTLRQFYRSRYGEQTVYIPNGVEPARPTPIHGIRRFGVSGKDYILFLGRIVPEKGVHYLIEAFRELRTDLKLLVTGGTCHTDAYWEQLTAMARGDDRIVFTGPLFGEDKSEVLSNAKLFVLPSDLEGMPIVLLEAMSYGLPVLSSDIPECREVFSGFSGDEREGRDHGPLCSSFRAGDSLDLRKELQAMIRDPALEEMGNRGRRHVLTHFNWDTIAQKTCQVYESILFSDSTRPLGCEDDLFG